MYKLDVVLQPMLQELGKQNPQLLRSIQEHDQEFLQLINEPMDGSDGLVAHYLLFAKLRVRSIIFIYCHDLLAFSFPVQKIYLIFNYVVVKKGFVIFAVLISVFTQILGNK